MITTHAMRVHRTSDDHRTHRDVYAVIDDRWMTNKNNCGHHVDDGVTFCPPNRRYHTGNVKFSNWDELRLTNCAVMIPSPVTAIPKKTGASPGPYVMLPVICPMPPISVVSAVTNELFMVNDVMACASMPVREKVINPPTGVLFVTLCAFCAGVTVVNPGRARYELRVAGPDTVMAPLMPSDPTALMLPAIPTPPLDTNDPVPGLVDGMAPVTVRVLATTSPVGRGPVAPVAP